mgnify:CR=1 FL=1
MSQRTFSVPEANEETEAFWAAVNEERLPAGHCSDCGAWHWFPRAICPHCHSVAVALRDTGGEGEIYTFSVMRRVPEPYAIAYVTLDEGVTMMTNIVDCDLDALAVGQRVRVRFVTAQDGIAKVPCFVPL